MKNLYEKFHSIKYHSLPHELHDSDNMIFNYQFNNIDNHIYIEISSRLEQEIKIENLHHFGHPSRDTKLFKDFFGIPG